MRKIFITMLASLLLAVNFGAWADFYPESVSGDLIGTEFDADKGYLLGDGMDLLFLTPNNELALVTPDVINHGYFGMISPLEALRRASWKIQVKRSSDNMPIFTFVNMETGTPLAMNSSMIYTPGFLLGEDAETPEVPRYYQNDGDLTEWYSSRNVGTIWASDGPLLPNFFYINTPTAFEGYPDAVIGWCKHNNDYEVITGVKMLHARYFASRTLANVSPEAVKLSVMLPDGRITLTANDLNTRFGTQGEFVRALTPAIEDGVKPFALTLATEENTFSLDIAKANTIASPFTKELQAWSAEMTEEEDEEDEILIPSENGYRDIFAESNNWLLLKTGEDEDGIAQYIVVDTAYINGTAQSDNKKIIITEDAITEDRLTPSYLFRFYYDFEEENIVIENAAYRTTNEEGEWVERNVRNELVLAQLVNETAYTLGDIEDDTFLESNYLSITLKDVVPQHVPAVIEEGVYLIQVIESENPDRVGRFVKLSLEGNLEFIQDEGDKNFELLPAAQWVFTKRFEIPGDWSYHDYGANNARGAAQVAPVYYPDVLDFEYYFNSFVNREFGFTPVVPTVFTVFRNIGSEFALNTARAAAMESQEFSTPFSYFAGVPYQGEEEGVIYFRGGDTFKLTKIDADDAEIGHYSEEPELGDYVNFMYLNALSGDDKPVYYDGTYIVIDIDGNSVNFELEITGAKDNYGYTGGLEDVEELTRNIYYLKVVDGLNGVPAYLAYKAADKKYYLTDDVTAASRMFIKEYYHIDKEVYYVLVEANMVNSVVEVRLFEKYVDGNEYIYEWEARTRNMFDFGYWDLDSVKTVGSVHDRAYSPAMFKKFYAAADANGNPIRFTAEQRYMEGSWLLDGTAPFWFVEIEDYKASQATGSQYLKIYFPVDYNFGIMGNGSNMRTSAVGVDDLTNEYNLYAFLLKQYGTSKVAVNDKTAILVNGVLDDAAPNEVGVATFRIGTDSYPYYRTLGVEADEKKDVNNIEIYRVNASAPEFLYEDANSNYSVLPLGPNTPAVDREKEGAFWVNFLGVEEQGNNAKEKAITAQYVCGTIMPQYLLFLGWDEKEGTEDLCEVCQAMDEEDRPEYCPHNEKEDGYRKARVLVSLASAKVPKGKTNAIYKWNENFRLAFADATFSNKDSLVTIPLINVEDKRVIFDEEVVAEDQAHVDYLFSFRLLSEDNNDFLIENKGKIGGMTGMTWVKKQNGVPVLIQSNFDRANSEAEVWNLNVTDKDAVANEGPAAGVVNVTAAYGTVTITGAAGEAVVITDVLGKTIANTTVNSDAATFSAPAGVAIVKVAGEAWKVLVK